VSSFKERIFHFGEDQNLLGILTEPATPADSSKPVILFLNAGVVHHIGPFRLGTEFARTLADDGFRSFRFDLSGLGDSNLGKSQVNAEQRFIDDAKAAMDTLQAQLGAATRCRNPCARYAPDCLARQHAAADSWSTSSPVKP
jgi:alpha-beta hydrolase superfamily lysophospholipase